MTLKAYRDCVKII